tara:strand:+ start:179 stop:379 length:201 start_codon:yes stop_codon:yes gene_type:complete
MNVSSADSLKKDGKINTGDLVQNLNSESGMIGVFIEFKTSGDYTYASVFWPLRGIKTIQPSLIRAI